MSETSDKKPKQQTLKFKAEVAELLNIVINSLYTDKEIFVRELVSNASDALEKLRHLQLTEKGEMADAGSELEINIHTDEEARTFSITDTGIGMTRQEAATNLGTIAHSGSREFMKQIEEGKKVDATLIGQFGVGFYAAFMVADKVTVHTRSWQSDENPVVWSSKGAGNFSLRETDDLPRGTTITVDLREEDAEYAKADTIKSLIRKYSNFVPFPIKVNGEQVNTIQPLWMKSKSDISDEELTEFYRFVANAFDEPTYKFQFNADAPLAIRSLLFVPGENLEKFGLSRMEPGVSLYCKKVMIANDVEELLPDYFRFFRGVVDSEDLPLNISRETMQDSALVAKLKRVLTGRLLKFLAEEAKDDAKKYEEFFKSFGMFIKEGAASDFEHRDDLAKLLRFDSTHDTETMTSLPDYVERMKEDQQAIYYISGPNREAIEAGPYLEALQERDFEVIYCYEGIDDFVMTTLREFDGKSLISADQADLKLPDKENEAQEDALDDKAAGDLASWIKNQLGDEVEEVRVSKRLTNSPALLVNPDEMMTTGMRRVMQAANRDLGPMGKLILEINPGHMILKRIEELRNEEGGSNLAGQAVHLMLDNARIAAGLLVDPKSLVERSTQILEAALNKR
ncbi:molecular chaperone HtpG [bacterium]|nr:molecular chaperone HtpG [bacterium]